MKQARQRAGPGLVEFGMESVPLDLSV